MTYMRQRATCKPHHSGTHTSHTPHHHHHQQTHHNTRDFTSTSTVQPSLQLLGWVIFMLLLLLLLFVVVVVRASSFVRCVVVLLCCCRGRRVSTSWCSSGKIHCVPRHVPHTPLLLLHRRGTRSTHVCVTVCVHRRLSAFLRSTLTHSLSLTN